MSNVGSPPAHESFSDQLARDLLLSRSGAITAADRDVTRRFAELRQLKRRLAEATGAPG